MNKITFPLQLRMNGDAIADLHTALVELGHSVSQGDLSARRFGSSTRDAVQAFQKNRGLPITGEVDEATANELNELIGAVPADEPETYRVSGRVVRGDGQPVEGAELRFFRQGITKRTPLGRRSTARTDAGGRFAFEYPRPDEPIELGIHLVADLQCDIRETRPRVIGNPGPHERTSFVVGDQPVRGPPSFERLENSIGAALDGEGVQPAEIVGFDEESMARLSLRTGRPPRELVLLRQAYAVAKDTGIEPAILFGMGKAGKVSIAGTAALLIQAPERRRAAVEAALSANEIPARLEKAAAAALEKLDELTVTEALTNPGASDITSIGTLLEAAGLSEDKRRKLAARYIAHTETPEDFWKQVSASGDLTAAEIGAVQLELQLAVATQYHAPLNQALKRRGVAKLEDLASLDKAAWLELIQGGTDAPGAGLPADLRAGGTSEEQYADIIFRVVEDALPTAMVSARVERFPDAPRIKAFLGHNPDYDLRTTPLRTYLAANPGALRFAAEATEADAIAASMKRLERSYRVAPPGDRVATMEALLADGLDSAHKIRALGRAAFVRSYETKLGSRAAAERVFRRANNASALAAIVATRYAPAFNTTPMYALPNPELPTMADLFGSQDYCACEHCQSVFGPAAYLVDLLHWLDGRPSALAGKTALDVLFEDRRADIGTVELSCTNTNTPLPTIDVVNEVLELLVAPPETPARYQTTGTPADLRAHPEHLRREAYAVLAGAQANVPGRDAVYPFDLPFDLWLQEARVYLGQLGIERHRLMKALLGVPAARADAGVAIETLGMSPAEWDIIAGQAQPPRQPHAFWGLDAGFVTALSSVSRLLERADTTEGGMAFMELSDLLRADFVQSQGPVSIAFSGSTCNTEEATLVGLTEPHLERLHRFIRLRHRLRWSVADLDRAITNLGGGAVDESCLTRIAHLERVAAQVERPVSELLSWWGPIDTRRWRLRLTEQLSDAGFELTFRGQLLPRPERKEDASPYDRKFLDPSLQVEPSTAFDINAAGDELATPVPQGLSAQLTPVASALGSTAEELGELLPLLGGQPPDLDLANLSALDRHISLARSLGLSARDLVSALALTGLDPFAGPGDTLAFIDEVHFIRGSGFSIEELDYLLRHVDSKPTTQEPDDTEIGVLLFELGAALRAAEAQHPPPDFGATEGVVVERLSSASGLEQSICAPLLRHLADPAGSGRSLLQLFLDDTVREHNETVDGTDEPILPSPSELPAHFGAYKLLTKAALLLNRLRIDKTELVWVLERGPGRGTLDVQGLPVTTGPASIAYGGWRRLREAILLRDSLSPRAALDLFEAAGGPQPDHEALLTELERRSRWDRADIEFLVGTPARPGVPASPGALGFQYPEDWKDERPLARLAEVMKVVRRVGLSAATIWDWRRIATSGSGTPAELQIAFDDHERQATEIKQAVRARHDQARWYQVAPALRDPLRERQRDALASWLSGNPRGAGLEPFADTAALSDHLLLDVEISPCQLTSRVKQALSSTQLLVQRVLLGLERDSAGAPLVELSSADAEEWGWRKSYRVWEANRQVFLYPENYLEPELRDDKTPFFIELEDELLQSEVTAETAATAVKNYLAKLDEVARLEIVGLCEQKDDGADILHVFGRTRGAPSTYYYRQRVDGVRWTPWEAVEAGIEGNHLIPVVFNRRLYVFWAMIDEAAIEEDAHIPALPELPRTAGRPLRYYEIHLAWSQRRDGAWTKKKVASDYIGRDLARFRTATGLRADIRREDHSSPADFFFRPLVVNAPAGSPAGQDLIIEPIRHRPPQQVGEALMARERGDGPGPGLGLDDCGAEPPVLDPPDDRPDDPEDIDESGYYRLPRFRMSGCDDTVTIEPRAGEQEVVALPPETIPVNQTFARFPELSESGELAFPAHSTGSGYSPQRALTAASPPFQLVPQRMDDFRSKRAFFYQDQRRTFFIEPLGSRAWVREIPEWVVATTVALESPRPLPDRDEPSPPPAVDPWDYDPAVAISSPAAVVLHRSAPAMSGGGLAARSAASLATSLGPRVASMSGTPVGTASTRLTLGSGASIANTRGEVIARSCPGGTVIRREHASATTDATHVMPALEMATVHSAPALTSLALATYRFETFYHPYACLMRRQLNRFGLDGLLAPSPSGPAPDLLRQQAEDSFFGVYGPTPAVRNPPPIDSFDFSSGGAYAIYNWELFFHVPFRVACQLSQNQRFAEAQKWFHYIFDPTESEGDAPRRFWKVKPLAALFHGENDDTGPIAELLLLLQYEGSDPAKLRVRDELIEEVRAMRANPFSPHALARLRLAVYARAVVMRYIDNLIDWGDHLFRRDTMESINEATQLYILAGQLLGRRPREVERETRPAASFADLRQAGLDAFGNALLEEIEGMLPETTESEADVYHDDIDLLGGTLFFCVPVNERLLIDYWGRVADRLFKIRHCMNIEGVVRQLPLFEPPIDPALLVRARSAGVDLASALSDLHAPLPFYRYRVLARRAAEICADVRGLGQALLAALEKKDAAELELLRAGHQVKLEEALLDVRRRQVDEAREALAALERSKESAEIRRDYYRSRPYMNPAELAQVALSGTAGLLDAIAGGVRAIGAIAAPDGTAGSAGFGGSPMVTFTFGGTQVSLSTAAAAAAFQTKAGIADRLAGLSGLIGSYERRRDDWQHQRDLADKDIESLERQIVAAEIRVAIADKDLSNLELQLGQSREAESFLGGKYTSVQLYQWMVRQLSSLHFQSYQLAYDMAKRAERAWQRELGLPDKTFIQFGYWDSLKKGLLAGERLHHDLQRMDAAYLEDSRREYELVRHVSLRELDPEALLRLKRDGLCHIDVPEEWFDLSTPGHYMRRIKTVALSLPSITGPYVSVPCTLTLESGSIRTSPDPGNPAFRDDLVDLQSIVTSQAQEDAGLFETSLGDDRYLPFEAAGAISKWRLELPTRFRPFDYETVSDAIIHIRYTARDGGKALREDAEQRVAAAIATGSRVHLVSARTDVPDAWASFLAPPQAQPNQMLLLNLDESLFPFSWRGSQISITGYEIFLVIEDTASYAAGDDVVLEVQAPDSSSTTVNLASDPVDFDGLPHGGVSFGGGTRTLGEWHITFQESANAGVAPGVAFVLDGRRRLSSGQVRDLMIAIRYAVA